MTHTPGPYSAIRDDGIDITIIGEGDETERPTVEPTRVLAYERYDKVYPWGLKEDTDSGYHLGVFRERQIAHQMALAFNCYADLVAALEAVEWVPLGNRRVCPNCGRPWDQGHAPTCKLAAALAKAKGE